MKQPFNDSKEQVIQSKLFLAGMRRIAHELKERETTSKTSRAVLLTATARNHQQLLHPDKLLEAARLRRRIMRDMLLKVEEEELALRASNSSSNSISPPRGNIRHALTTLSLNTAEAIEECDDDDDDDEHDADDEYASSDGEGRDDCSDDHVEDFLTADVLPIKQE